MGAETFPPGGVCVEPCQRAETEEVETDKTPAPNIIAKIRVLRFFAISLFILISWSYKLQTLSFLLHRSFDLRAVVAALPGDRITVYDNRLAGRAASGATAP